MSCNHCSTNFNFFHKEQGCANCGLSFCGNCLKQKCKIPSKGSEKFKVCRVCYSKLTSGAAENKEPIIPPDRFLKRLENLENPAAPPITVYRQDPKINALKSGLSSADQKLVDRLEKLKEKQVVPPSDSEIRERLAKLKGDNVSDTSGAQKPLFTADKRSDEEKIASLLEQFTAEKGIEFSHQSQDDLGQRLATLKGEEYKKNNIDPDYEELDSEEEVDKITKKIMAESLLDQKYNVDNSENSEKIKDEEEVDYSDEDEDDDEREPFCCVCYKHAIYICPECEGDHYCSKCNIEVHNDFGDPSHKPFRYDPKNPYKY